jgi:hypothetical protein
MEYWFPAYFVLALFMAALNPKALGTVIVFGLGLVCFYPDTTKAGFLALFCLPAYLLASFRD